MLRRTLSLLVTIGLCAGASERSGAAPPGVIPPSTIRISVPPGGAIAGNEAVPVGASLIQAVVLDGMPQPRTPKPTALRFEVTIAEKLGPGARSGRLLVMLNPSDEPEPRFWVGEPGTSAPPFLARDVEALASGAVAVLDDRAAIFPIRGLGHLEAGEYHVQAVLANNPDLRGMNQAGNLYSVVRKLSLEPAAGGTVRIELSEQVPPEELPKDTEHLKFLKFRSDLLSQVHGRPIYLRAGVILPKLYAQEPARRYPLRVQIGGYGGRYTYTRTMMREDRSFRRAWETPYGPQMVVLHLDGAGPYGDPYQVNSRNNGPYGDAITGELIPYIERTYRCIGQPWARVLTGQSTGGWVSVALQVLYPGFFGGCWAFSPDSLDFRSFQLVNLYEDGNAYFDGRGRERPASRHTDGGLKFTMRNEVQMENVMGAGDCWANSGGQWGAWNAVYGPRGADGRPVPVWDPRTGRIDHTVAREWEPYDVRLVLERTWETLAPKLRGKIRIWVGELDNYFLNLAVHRLEEFLKNARPSYEGSIVFGPDKGHGWMPISELQLMREMVAAVEKGRPGRPTALKSPPIPLAPTARQER